MGHGWRWGLARLVMFALLSASAMPATSQGLLPSGPDAGDENFSPFYRWSRVLPQRPGVMLREEAAKADPYITDAAAAQRILYTSTDGRWNSGLLPVSGTFYLPKGREPRGGWPLIAWAHGTLGVADRCAPSWIGHKPRDATYINRWLAAGYAVVATDYQGLGGPGPHAYLVWRSEGQSILDGIRAVRGAYPGKLAPSVIITGQSQGSAAALGATRLQPTYAPDVPLTGTVATGVAARFPDSPYPLQDQPGGSLAHYTVLRLVGGSLRDGVAPESVLSAKGQAMLPAARRGCTAELRAVADRDGVTTANAFKTSAAALDAELLPVWNQSSERMPVPLLLGTGLADALITPRYQYSAVRALCAGGSNVTWKTYAGVGHNGSVNAAFDDALAFARAVRSGRTPPNTCGAAVEPGQPGKITPGPPFND